MFKDVIIKGIEINVVNFMEGIEKVVVIFMVDKRIVKVMLIVILEKWKNLVLKGCSVNIVVKRNIFVGVGFFKIVIVNKKFVIVNIRIDSIMFVEVILILCILMVLCSYYRIVYLYCFCDRRKL